MWKKFSFTFISFVLNILLSCSMQALMLMFTRKLLLYASQSYPLVSKSLRGVFHLYLFTMWAAIVTNGFWAVNREGHRCQSCAFINGLLRGFVCPIRALLISPTWRNNYSIMLLSDKNQMTNVTECEGKGFWQVAQHFS